MHVFAVTYTIPLTGPMGLERPVECGPFLVEADSEDHARAQFDEIVQRQKERLMSDMQVFR